MPVYSPLTVKVVAFSILGSDYDIAETIDWALDMLALGYETPNLLILASLSKPANYFETIEYFKNTCLELALPLKTGEEAIISYSSFYIHQLAAGHQVRENLAYVYSFCQVHDYTDLLSNFYLLYWAWEDFDYNDTFTSYWPKATPQNIEHLVIQEAQDWLIRNKLQVIIS